MPEQLLPYLTRYLKSMRRQIQATSITILRVRCRRGGALGHISPMRGTGFGRSQPNLASCALTPFPDGAESRSKCKLTDQHEMTLV